VRSVTNALERLGCEVNEVRTAADIEAAEILVFPGVGAFGSAVAALEAMGAVGALRRYLGDGDRPFLGVCLGMQLLFSGSEETPGARGLGVIDGTVARFAPPDGAAVPHMGWNVARRTAPSTVLGDADRVFPRGQNKGDFTQVGLFFAMLRRDHPHAERPRRGMLARPKTNRSERTPAFGARAPPPLGRDEGAILRP
jgi:hypothetical protein